jgi:large subunit ribosomal protein L24
MKVKVGDNVKILAGKDRGKEGRIIKTLKKENKVVVEGINMIKKHIKPNRMSEVGSIQEMEAPIHVSNVKVVEASKKAPKKEAKVDTKKEETKAPKKAVANKTTKKTEKKAS